MSVRSAQWVEVLHEITDSTRNFGDSVPAPGQYLKVRTHEKVKSKRGVKRYGMKEQVIDVYVPGSANSDWVMDRDGATMGANEKLFTRQMQNFMTAVLGFRAECWIQTQCPMTEPAYIS